MKSVDSKLKLAGNLARHAEEYINASRRLSSTPPFIFYPTFYCALHSIELSLKAHLVRAGVSKKKLASRRLGHDLTALLAAAKSSGIIGTLGLTHHDIRSIEEGAKGYPEKDFEYPEFTHVTLPIGIWQQCAEKLLKAFFHKLAFAA